MTRTAFLFPGQGSQSVGMGADLVEQFPHLFDRFYRPADRILGFAISDLCFRGPLDRLLRTSVTQPAVFLTSVATLDALGSLGIKPDVVAGHSLGEYAAMVAAEVLDWQDGLRLVWRRGALMESANERTKGRMAAVLGIALTDIESMCDEARRATGEIVEVANDNCPAQVVVSGTEAGVAALMTLARDRGAERVVPLPVGAAFHSALMRGVETDFADELRRMPFRPPAIGLVTNVTADYAASADAARECLRRQITGRVRWTETVRRLHRDGIDTFVEVGPGKVLSGLVNSTLAGGGRTFVTSDARRFRKTLDALAA